MKKLKKKIAAMAMASTMILSFAMPVCAADLTGQNTEATDNNQQTNPVDEANTDSGLIVDDEFEYAYQMKEISFEIYKARERAIEKLEDELELVEEALENKYGIDD